MTNRINIRRWVRFSTRTLLIVVALFCVWLGWQWRIVQERKSLIALVRQRNYVTLKAWPDANVALSGVRRLLGDELLHALIYVPEGSLSAQQRRDIARALPEAQIFAGEASVWDCGLESFDP